MDLYTWVVASAQNEVLARDPARRRKPLICGICAAVYGTCVHTS